MPDRLRRKISGWVVLAGLAALIVALRGASLLYSHSLNSIDGAMQTWFALDHFAHGDQLGSAFQSYLGVTMVLALLPVFVAFGKTLFASTLAANALVVAGSWAGCCAIVWLIRPIPPGARWQVSVLLVFGFYYLARWAAEGIGLPYPATFDPGVSLRPLRGALPFFVLPVFVWALRRVLRERRALLGGGVLSLAAGVGLLWSNDAGIPLVLALALGLTTALWREAGVLGRTLAAFGLGLSGSVAAILLAVTHGAPSSWLQYNFSDVAADQFWYFAPWGRSTRTLGPGDLPNILQHGELLSSASLIALVLCVLWAVVRRMRGVGSPVRGSAFIFVGASVIGTALLPQIGGHIGAEYNAITFVLGACAPLIVMQKAWLRLAKPALRKPRFGSMAALAAMVMVGAEAVHLAQVREGADRTVYDPALGFYVTPQYTADLAAMRRLRAWWEAEGVPANRQLLSVYTSSLDVAAGTRSPAPVGSLIHALGPANRAAFTALVAERKVAAVTTIAPDYSGWEGWIRRANWPFFRALYRNYTPIARGDQQVLWVRAESETPNLAPAACRVRSLSSSAMVIEVAAPASGWATVTIVRTSPFATGRSAMLTVTETSPDTASKGAERWADFPRYGVANTPRLSLLAPVAPDTATRLTLGVLDGSAIGRARCGAMVAAAVDTAHLPSLPTGIARYLAQSPR